MTNEELLDKIKAEIERLKDENNNIRCDSNKAYCQGYGDAFVDLLPFLSTHESEKPASVDLEEVETKKDEKVPTRIYLGDKHEFIRRDIILKEIEGLKKNNEVSDDSEHAPYELDVACGYDMACDDFLSFLSTLEEQQKEVRNPIFDECVAKVDQKVREEVRENIDFEQELYNHFGQIKDFTFGMRIGKYFYELGCRRTAEKYDEIEYNRQKAEEENK